MKTTATPESRQAMLDNAICLHARDWRLVQRTETQAQLVSGKPVSHVLHLLLSLITLGLWIPIWILVALVCGEKYKLLRVDEYGTVRAS